MTDTSINACGLCGMPSNRRCCDVFYCSEEHQKQHWSIHQHTCSSGAARTMPVRKLQADNNNVYASDSRLAIYQPKPQKTSVGGTKLTKGRRNSSTPMLSMLDKKLPMGVIPRPGVRILVESPSAAAASAKILGRTKLDLLFQPYAEIFAKGNHWNFVCSDSSVASIIGSTVLLRTSEGYEMTSVQCRPNVRSMCRALAYLHLGKWVGAPSEGGEQFVDALLDLDARLGFKRQVCVGLVLCKTGQQTEEEMLANSEISESMQQFLSDMGATEVGADSQVWRSFSQEPQTTGYHARWRDFEFLFHAAPGLAAAQRSSTIAQDHVLIFFCEGSPFKVARLNGAANNYAIIASTEKGANEYHLCSFRRAGVTKCDPVLPMAPVSSPELLQELLYLKLIKADRASRRFRQDANEWQIALSNLPSLRKKRFSLLRGSRK